MAKNDPKLSGQQLVADFQTAYIAIATSEVAHSEAAKSEDNLLQQLAYWSRGGYLNPGSIEAGQQPDVSRASLDAHIKKLQATQVDEMKVAHIETLVQNDGPLYRGKKVQIDVIAASESPIDILWFSAQTGYRSNASKKQRVSGTIQEIIMDKGILLVKPARLQRALNKELMAYVVYVINPNTAEPMVSISLT